MYDDLVNRLHRYSENCVAYKLDADYASAVQEAADVIEELENKLNLWRQDKVSRWIPVTERLPEDLKFVLAVEDGTVFVAHCEHYYGEEEAFVEWHDTMYYPANPTHWMPLPEPPEKEK